MKATLRKRGSKLKRTGTESKGLSDLFVDSGDEMSMTDGAISESMESSQIQDLKYGVPYNQAINLARYHGEIYGNISLNSRTYVEVCVNWEAPPPRPPES